MAPYKKTKVSTVELNMTKNDNDEELEGPVADRTCRDVPCCILFVVFMLGMITVAGLALKQGSPYSLFYGVDSWGNVCNDKNPGFDLRGLKRSMRFDAATHYLSLIPGMDNITLSAYVGGSSHVICVSECPNATLTSSAEVDAYKNETGANYCYYNVTSYLTNSSLCAGLPIIPQTSILNRCVPALYVTMLTQSVNAYLSTMAAATVGPDFIKNIIQDVESSHLEILMLCGISIGSSLLIVALMQFIAGIVIWAMVFLIAASGLSTTGYTWYTYYNLNEAYKNLTAAYQTPAATEEVRLWMVYSILATIITVIFLFILLFLRKRIGLVVQLFREAGSAIRRIPMILLQPLWTIIFLGCSITVLAIITLYVETTGKASLDSSGFVQYQKDEVWEYLRWYHLFGALWLTAFIFACQDVVIAGAVATWYFNRTKKSLGWPIWAAAWRLFRYHLGSVAFGSFIIALIRFIRMLLAYIQRQVKGRTGKVADFMLKAVACCLYCFEKFIAYLNTNAYIEIAIYGHSFCTAARKAFMLILANVVRVAAINSLGDFVLFLGKLIPVGIVIVAGKELLKNRTDLNMSAIPITLSAAFAFAVGHCFFGVYEMVIDTIFVCFCEDCDQNDGVDKPYFMSKGLMTYLSNSDKVNMRRNKPKAAKEDQVEISDVEDEVKTKQSGSSIKTKQSGSSVKAKQSGSSVKTKQSGSSVKTKQSRSNEKEASNEKEVTKAKEVKKEKIDDF